MEGDKVRKVEWLIHKLKAVASKSIKKGSYEKALSAIAVCAYVLYEYNQWYTDDELEEMLLYIGHKVVYVPDDFCGRNHNSIKTVLFYDGFGLDTRGLAITKTRAIAGNGYKLIYVTNEKSRNKQSELKKELAPYNVIYKYINMEKSYLEWIKHLNAVFLEYEPEVAYFYTTPCDVAGVVVFDLFEGKVTRFQSDLTDHAFWLGVKAFDFCVNSRTMGESIEHYYRGIPVEKLIRSHSSLYVNENVELKPLPFDTDKYRYVFSGGALYKTLGDSEKIFYKMIEHIITCHEDVNFVYAGEGDRTQFDILLKKYPGRVFLFHERDDFYKLIEECVFYLNTYPMFGGLMMRFAANAFKLPVTLKHEHDAEGILLQQKKLGIEFTTYEEIIAEIDKLLENDAYRKEKEKILSSTVITKERAMRNEKNIIENHRSEFQVEIERYDTTEFRLKYIERLDYAILEKNCIAKKINHSLLPDFPVVFIKKVLEKFFHN